MARRPRVGVTGPARRGGAAWLFTAWAVARAGGAAVRLRPGISAIPEDLDGMIIGGGDDIDPVLYDEPDDTPDVYDSERDQFEQGIIAAMLQREDMPLMGICRGAQLLNVVLGGTLHKDVRHMRLPRNNRDTVLPLKHAELEKNCFIASVVQENTLRINSLHHQAIRRTGEGLRAVAVDGDRIIQAIEHETRRFTLGVQWHPEYLPYMAPHRRLFQQLVAACSTGKT